MPRVMEFAEEPREPDPLDAVYRTLAQKEADLTRREAANAAEKFRIEEERRSLDATRAEAEKHIISLRAIMDGLEILGEPLPTALPHGELKRAVHQAVDMRVGPFSTLDVINGVRMNSRHIKVDSNRANISMYLREMVENQTLVLLAEGKGQTPAIFIKK